MDLTSAKFRRVLQIVVFLLLYYWLLNSKEFKEHCDTIHEFADSIVAERLVNKSEKHTQDARELKNETLHVLITGRDTTRCLLSWVYQKLRKAVLEQFGENQADFFALNNFNYIQWVINESLRIAIVIPMNEHRAQRDTVLQTGGGPDGMSMVFAPKGTQVLIPLYAMRHRKDIWVNDAEDFRPERWATHRPGWEWIPFGEVSYIVSRFCQKYDSIENMEQGDGQIRLHRAIENRSGTGVQIRIHEVE
ncbi:cytochrome p450 protein [Apiospora saccharicola]